MSEEDTKGLKSTQYKYVLDEEWKRSLMEKKKTELAMMMQGSVDEVQADIQGLKTRVQKFDGET